MVNEIIDLKGRGKLTLQILNGHQIVLDSYMALDISIEYMDATKRIKSVCFNSDRTYSIGKSLSMSVIAKTPYTFSIKEIYQLTPTTFLFTTDKRNKSVFYIAPSVFTHKSKLGWTNYKEGRFTGYDNCSFINTYLEYGETIKYLLVKYLFTTDESYLTLEKDLESNPNFIERIDVGQYTYFKFQIPERNLSDVELFLDGKYSKLSLSLKKDILAYMTDGRDKYYSDLAFIKDNQVDKIVTPLAQGLFLHPDLNQKVSEQLGFDIPLDWELMSKPNYSEEVIIL